MIVILDLTCLVCLCVTFLSLDVAPLSAPAFSFCFPLLNAMLRESSGSTEETENMMTRALQVVNQHSQLRASTESDDIVIDEVEDKCFLFLFLSCASAHEGGRDVHY